MESREIFWFAGLCLVLCAVPSRLEYLFENEIDMISNIADIKSDEEWSNKDANNSRLEQMIWKREASFSRRGIDANNADCSRYCIRKTGDAVNDSVKRVNIIWKIVDDSRVTFTAEPSSNWGVPGSSTREKDFLWEPTRISFDKTGIFSDDDPKCELYLELGCEAHNKSNINIHALSDKFLNLDEKKLVTMDLTEGYTEREFNVDKVTEELRILALGKLSQAILEIPIASRAEDSPATRTPDPTLSLSRTSDGKGVRLDARNPPSGRWRLKLLGVENSNYSFSVVAASTKAIVKASNADVFTSARSQTGDVANPKKKLSKPQRLAYLKTNDDNAEAKPIKSDDQQMLVDELLPADKSADEPEMLEFSKFLRGSNLEAEVMESQVDDKTISGRSSLESPAETAKIVEDSELEELSRSSSEIQTRTRKTVVDLSPNTQLIAVPGYHNVIFTVTNNQGAVIRHVVEAHSTTFPIVRFLPSFYWIRPGQTIPVVIQIQVPNTQDTSPSIITLSVRNSENFEFAKKSTYIYVQGSNQVPTTDTDKPSIDYFFNDNCNGKLNRDRCNRSFWSVEVTVKDPDSGLKTVTSMPKYVEPRTEFIAGTKNAVTFYYSSTCCYHTVDIKATDVQGNVYTRTIDVTDWYNLSQGEIAAIVVGALLILLLLILIILLIIYCVRKRKSHDLSYSQRYGSRTPASAERTNF